MESKKLKLYYYNLPTLWAFCDKDDYSISQERFENILAKLQNVPQKAVVYMQNGCKLFVPQLLDTYKFFGIHFPSYFDATFNKDEQFEFPFAYDIAVIYDIGFEKALNTEFAAKLLLGLIKQIQNENKAIFLCSHLSYSEFYKKYEIDIVNKLSVKEKEENKFL
jgi:predicted nucleic-acid-binding Zn-ribbon protein